MSLAASKIDVAAAEQAADRVVLAYELADALYDFAHEVDERRAAACTVAAIVSVFTLIQMGVTEKQAISEFGKTFRIVRRRVRKLGAKATLAEVITEMHLDQRK